MWSALEAATELDDPSDLFRRQGAGGSLGPGTTVLQPRLPLRPESMEPLVHRGSRDVGGFGDLRRRPVQFLDSTNQQQAAPWRESRFRMDHESLLLGQVVVTQTEDGDS